jgi:beta-lactamase class A
MTRRPSQVSDVTDYPVDDLGGKVRWGISVLVDGCARFSANSQAVFSTASIGKVFLLAALSQAFEEGSIQRDQRLRRSREDWVGDSGIWQFMAEDELSIETLAVLIAAVSDNLATNVLLRHVGISACEEISNQARMPQTRLLDRIRDLRGPEDPPRPSQGRAEDLARLVEMIATRQLLNEQVSAELEHWMSINTDLSMVAGALGLDPIAHADCMAGTRLFNKTGTDAGVRADTGCVEVPDGKRISYAVLANWNPGEVDDAAVMAALAHIGTDILSHA